MKVWVLTIGEPLPTDEGKPRLLRSGLLTRILANRGHDVTWWTSSFNHAQKQYRANRNETVALNDNLRICMLHAQGYRKNVSIARIINHIKIADEFGKWSRREQRPDIILTSLPSIALSAVATDFGREYSVPVVVDVRDLWPDIFLDIFPSFLRGGARIALIPAFRMARKACAQATAITGCTKPFVDWGLQKAGRTSTELDKEFFMGYSNQTPSEEEIKQAREFWRSMGIIEGHKEFIVCFFGYLGLHFNLESVIQAARLLKEQGKCIRFVFCGAGEKLDYYKAMASDCENVLFPGWVDFPKIWFLQQNSSVGLAPYKNIDNFTLNLPNKPAEYFSAALPILTSIRGVLGNLLEETASGLIYQEGKPADFAEKLIFLYDNPQKRQLMSQNALHLYNSRFKADNIYNCMADYLETIGKARKSEGRT